MTNKIKKILIANRGEIACRVIKTARKMGIATVAVYSDADRKALHVRMADEAVHIGPSPANESYLVIDKLIAAAKETGADAVHPGYGFLSENPDFVRACEKAGLNFIGPAAESMEAMGLKDAAKKLMDAAGVPTTPGYHGEDQSPKLLKAKAGMIGYPVLIKAVAGGGGKGMRKVEADKDFDAALASCQREAKSSFGNDDVLIEKYIQSPRHIEVQVFGDTHGNVVHMFERDCSLQRRHQKVIEEAPAPGMTDEVRAAMTTAAIEAAKAVNYVGAGTVEFIVDGSGKLRKDGFWFMEMNTRLQVEHPVTEMITGLDLVEWQIRVAQGEKLPKQNAIKMEGHAVEARLYAEDPANDFLPSTGKIDFIDHLEDYISGDVNIRIDSGVERGSEISVYYDPMIAKVIGYGTTRDLANESCGVGLSCLNPVGIKTNAQFLSNCLDDSDFEAGNISTHFIPPKLEDLIGIIVENHDELYVLAAIYYYQSSSISNPFSQNDGWRLNQTKNVSYVFDKNGQPITIKLISISDGEAIAEINSSKTKIIYMDDGNPNRSMKESLNHYYDWDIESFKDHLLFDRESICEVVKLYDFSSTVSSNSSNALTASMPGKIIAVNTKTGDTVKSGDPLIVMEAMKMEMTLEAPRDGVVAEVNFEAGALVSDGEVLLTLEEIQEDK